MAVMDFREGGYVFSRHKVKREFSYDQGAPDEQRFAADPAGGDSFSARMARLTHYVGALASVGLMVGLLAWGWQLVSRDVSGIPVIRAIEGEARTAPENPGGELTSYTGYAVNNVAEGTETAPASRVAIAPAATDLASDDVAMGRLGAEAREPSQIPDMPLSFDGEPITPMSDSEARAFAEAQAAAEAERLALTEQAIAAAEIIDAPATEGSVNGVVTDENGRPADADAINAALIQAQAEANPGVLTASVRPAPRPRVVRTAAAGTVATDAGATSAQRPAESRPAEVPQQPAASSASGPQVQLGAFDSSAIATNEWNRLAGKHGTFGGKQQVIQQHKSDNGRTFWRLRVAGFGSIGEARDFCARLKSGGTDCIALGQ